MKQQTILVTGSAGFIGFHTTKRLLEEGHTIIGIDNLNEYYSRQLKLDRNDLLRKNKAYHFYEADITDGKKLETIVKKYNIEKICHMAAQAGVRYSLENPFAYEETNNKGFLTILEVAKKNKINHIVYASSSSVYGGNLMPKGGFSEEDVVNKPISVYGVTKRSNELLAYTYHHLYGIDTTGLRFFTAYGPWGRPDMAYFKFLDSINQGKKIDVYNNGKMKRDFTYIDDIVDGVVAAIKTPFAYEIFNLGNSQSVDLVYFISCLEKELNKKAKINYLPLQPGDLLKTYANIEKSKKYLGFEPKTNIEKGLHEFVIWYKEYTKIV